MFFFPLVLGALAVQLPFVAVILLWLYFAKIALPALQQPIKAMGAFFIVPILILLLDTGSTGILPSLDAILGVGIPSLVFLVALSRQSRTTTALSVAVASLVIYGTTRAYVFGDLLASIQTDANTQLQSLMPSLVNQEVYAEALSLVNMMMPGIWISMQALAMVIGLLVFHRQLKLPFLWTRIQFPLQYNLLLLAVLPLYLLPDMHLIMFTAALGASVLPCVQGISLIVNYLSRTIVNKVFRWILLALILINQISLIFIAILGFADIWLNLRKIETEGSPA